MDKGLSTVGSWQEGIKHMYLLDIEISAHSQMTRINNSLIVLHIIVTSLSS